MASANLANRFSKEVQNQLPLPNQKQGSFAFSLNHDVQPILESQFRFSALQGDEMVHKSRGLSGGDSRDSHCGDSSKSNSLMGWFNIS